MSGIYLIENMRNGKVYVGQAGSFVGRWLGHRKMFKKGVNSPHLQRAWKKYGDSAFRFEILEVCKKDRDVLNQREQFWMDFFLSYDPRFGYNIAPVAGSKRGTKWSKESKEKISGIGNGFYGKKHSKETKELLSSKFSKDKNPNFGKQASSKTRLKMSVAKKGKYVGRDNPNYGNGDKIRGSNNPNYGNGYKVAGEHNPRAKLSWLKVEEIRKKFVSETDTIASLAKQYEVSWTAIKRIVEGRSWKTEIKENK